MSARELARFLTTIRGPRRMSQEAVEATARDFADVMTGSREDRELLARILVRGASAEPQGQSGTAAVGVQARPPGVRLTAEEADRLAQERPPYPPKSDVPSEQCPGPTGWHRPQVVVWNSGDRESTCTWCGVAIGRNFGDPVWRQA